jgi:hypothetical protein
MMTEEVLPTPVSDAVLKGTASTARSKRRLPMAWLALARGITYRDPITCWRTSAIRVVEASPISEHP